MTFRKWIKRTSEENAWWSARNRCLNPKNASYHRYGGRGIYMDDSWVGLEDGLEAFLRDMGPKPSSEHSLDRIDNDGPYAHWNCRWATPAEQSNNKSNNIWRAGHQWDTSKRLFTPGNPPWLTEKFTSNCKPAMAPKFLGKSND